MRLPDGKRISNSRLKNKGDIASVAAESGLPGLIYVRIKENSEIEAAKPVMEGLDTEASQKLIELTQAQPVSHLILPRKHKQIESFFHWLQNQSHYLTQKINCNTIAFFSD